MKVTRRGFLKTVGVVGVGTFFFNPALSVFGETTKEFDKDRNPNQNNLKGTKAVGQWIPSTCQGCTTWCPVEVYVQGGRAVKVRGNQNSMINPGKVCPRGHMIPQETYDPDRLKVPMKRTNVTKGKGIDPQFVPITWDEALDLIATKIMELRTADETHKYMFLRGRYSYSTDLIYSAMTKIIGSPNGVSHSAICAEVEKIAPYFLENYYDYRDYDLLNTKYLLLWGVDPFRSNRQIPHAMDRWATVKDNAIVTVVDPSLTVSASKANNWLPVLPGEDGALASAIAHYILVQGSWNKTFVGDFNGTGANSFIANTVAVESDFTEIYTSGLITWWNLELKDKTPEWAETKCGISAATIKQVALDMAAAAPNVCVWLGPGAAMAIRGTYTAMAIHALSGLLGSTDSVGGHLRYASLSTTGIPSVTAFQDTIATNGASQSKIVQGGIPLFPLINKSGLRKAYPTNNVPNAMLAADPYDIKVAIGCWCNFAFSGTEPQRWWNALEQLPFFAHITTNASEMSQFADVLLPAAHPTTEKWSYLKTHGNRYSEATIQQPLATRLFDVRADENEISYLLAKKLNEKGFSNLLDYYNSFVDPETAATPIDEYTFAEIATKLFTFSLYSNATNSMSWDTFKATGVAKSSQMGYNTYWPNFGTPSGKFEFFSQKLQSLLTTHATNNSTTIDAVLTACNYEAQGDLAFVPHYEAPYRYGNTTDYPFTFIDAKSRYNREGRSQNLPLYYQFKKNDPGDENWSDVVKINPSDAATLGIVNGDTVKITSITASITCKAKLWEGIRPGTVSKCYGQGHWAYGRFASDYSTFTANGGNNNEIMKDEYDRITGSTARNGGFMGVKIEKVIV